MVCSIVHHKRLGTKTCHTKFNRPIKLHDLSLVYHNAQSQEIEILSWVPTPCQAQNALGITSTSPELILIIIFLILCRANIYNDQIYGPTCFLLPCYLFFFVLVNRWNEKQKNMSTLLELDTNLRTRAKHFQTLPSMLLHHFKFQCFHTFVNHTYHA